MCSFVALQHASLVDHVCTIHREHPNFHVYCESCLRSYTKWDSYKKHRSRGCKGGQRASHVLTGEAEDLSMSIADNDPVDDDDGDAPMPRPPQQWHEAAFILSVKEQHVLSQAAVDHVISSAKSLVSNVFDVLLNTLTDRLPEDSMKVVKEQVQQVDESLFGGLLTSYQQEKYFQQKFNIVVSMQYSYTQPKCLFIHFLSQNPVSELLGQR